MTSQPKAFFAIDSGSATCSATLVGHVGGRWRVVANTSAPVSVPLPNLLTGLLRRIAAADDAILDDLGAEPGADFEKMAAEWPRLVARSTPPRTIVVLAGSRRQRRRLEEAALRAGWLTTGASADESDALAMARLLHSPSINAVLVGSDHTPTGDEKRHLPEIVALVASATAFRPDLTVVLAGGAAAYEGDFSPSGATPAAGPAAGGRQESERVSAAKKNASKSASKTSTKADAAGGLASDGPSEAAEAEQPMAGASPQPAEGGAHALIAPDAEAGSPPGSSLQQVLEGLRALPNDGRIGIARSIASLAYVLDRSVEAIEVGLAGGIFAHSEPLGASHFTTISSHTCLADGSFAPVEPSDEVIDGILSWSTSVQDRHRVLDRLQDLRLVPWGDGAGEGAHFRLAAAKAAAGRLIAGLPDVADKPMPEMVVAAGGIFASLPPSIVAMAIADLLRRPGIGRLVADPCRLLGPLGTIEDEAERRRLLSNLADEMLLPLGTLITPLGVRAGRTLGQLRLKGSGSISEIEMHPGAVQVVDLPPGRKVKAELEFRDNVKLVNRGHHFVVEIEGGLAGVLLDLRDIPMRISDRPDTRRAALDAWQRGMWPEIDE